MNAKHTPGPWFVDHQWDASGWIDITPAATDSAFPLPLASTRHYPETRANAQLIAAAPELLQALNAMLTQFGMDEDDWSKPTFDQARAAIAKATGGAQ